MWRCCSKDGFCIAVEKYSFFVSYFLFLLCTICEERFCMSVSLVVRGAIEALIFGSITYSILLGSQIRAHVKLQLMSRIVCMRYSNTYREGSERYITN
jgi:hypothetical protein